jgi:hypothetical protein
LLPILPATIDCGFGDARAGAHAFHGDGWRAALIKECLRGGGTEKSGND